MSRTRLGKTKFKVEIELFPCRLPKLHKPGHEGRLDSLWYTGIIYRGIALIWALRHRGCDCGRTLLKMRKGKGADIFRSDRFFDEGGCWWIRCDRWQTASAQVVPIEISIRAAGKYYINDCSASSFPNTT